MADMDTEVEITFTISTSYSWNGPLSDLPAAVRKGALTGRGEDRELDVDVVRDNLDNDNALLDRLAKKADETDTQYEIEDVSEL